MPKILIAGDFVPNDRVKNCFDRGDFESVLADVQQYTSNVDYSIVNLETPVIEGDLTPIKKNGPNLSASLNAIDAVSFAGFNAVTLANNHFYDQGEKGALMTLAECDRQHIDIVGGGQNLKEASKTLYKEISGKRFAFINCCEYEYSIATANTAGSNPIDPIKQFYAITEARKNADYVIVICHGGIELFQYPTLRMVSWYRFFVDAGADVVINHHQHCISGYEIYNGKPICYGLGNFCFDHPNKRNSAWNFGYMVGLNFSGTRDVALDIIPYSQCNNLPKISVLQGDEKGKILSEIALINDVIKDEESLSTAVDGYMSRKDYTHNWKFTPYRRPFLRVLLNKKLLPQVLNKQNWMEIRDLVFCESHRERFIHFLKTKI